MVDTIGTERDSRKPPPKPGFSLREMPDLVIFALTLGGVAYTSVARRPLVA